MTSKDSVQRFLFENTDIRGERVLLDQSLQEALANHAYPDSIRVLLGELSAASVLLSTTLKFEGTMTLQARSTGPLQTLMVECTDKRTFRAIARWSDEQLSSDAKALHDLMPEGHLVLTIDPVNGKRYQGIVPLMGANLSECFNDYFEQSEQLSTRLWLESNGQGSAGFLLQALPASEGSDATHRAERWEHLTVLAETLKPEEMMELPTEELLHRLYHEEEVRLFDADAVKFHCNCSRERTGNALTSIQPEELKEILEEQGKVEMDCQFCNTRYIFTAEDINALMGNGATRH